MKKTLADLTKTTSKTALAPAAGSDVLDRINDAVNNITRLFEIAAQYKGLNVQNARGAGFSSEAAPDLKTNLVKFLDFLNEKGFGNTTIAEVLRQVSPATIKQITELIRNVGSGK